MAFDIEYHRQLADHGVGSPDITPQEVCKGLANALDHAADVQARFVAYIKRETAVISVGPGAVDVILRATLAAHEKRGAALAEQVVRLTAELGWMQEQPFWVWAEERGEDQMCKGAGETAVAKHRETPSD